MNAFERLREGFRGMSFPTTHDKLKAAREHFDAVIAEASKPDADLSLKAVLPRAQTRRAFTLMTAYLEGWEDQAALVEAEELTRLATNNVYGKYDYDTHWDRAFYYYLTEGKQLPNLTGEGDNFAQAIATYKIAIGLLDKADVDLYLEASDAYVAAGDLDGAMQMVRTAGRFVSHDWYRWQVAWVYYFKGLDDPEFYSLAIDEIRKMYWNPGEPEFMFDIMLLLAAAYSRRAESRPAGAGADADKAKAKTAFELFKAKKLESRLEWTQADQRRAMPLNEDFMKHWLGGCELAGLK